MPPRKVAAINRKLEMAWQILLDESCPNCGVPIWHGHSTLSSIEFCVDTSTCYGCQADANYKDKHKMDEGESTRVRAFMTDEEEPLVTRQDGLRSLPTPKDPYAQELPDDSDEEDEDQD